MLSGDSSIRGRLNGRENSLGALRLAFAAAVIFSHAFPLGGRAGDPTSQWWNGQAHIGGVAVFGFLGISGYVVTKSAARLSPGRFAWHRVLRLYPAFWVALIVGAFAISPIVWGLSGRDMGAFWAEPNGPLSYVTRNAALWVQQWDIHDLFAPQPLGVSPSVSWLAGAVNGSLWTLAYELMCYILIGALAAWGVLRRARYMIPVIAGVFGLMQIATRIRPGAATVYVPLLDDSMITLGWVFMLGATAAVYSASIPLRSRYALPAAAIAIATLWLGGFHVIGIPAFVYATLWAGAALPRLFHHIGAKNDYSYGLYLYGWPVAQVLGFAGLQEKMWLYILLTLAGAGLMAWLSWHGVEKQAMRLKDVQWGHLRVPKRTAAVPTPA
ncbi:acyltransferase family protein [Microbacterium sp. NPDC058021]|uniref:acyltransferase family protein n=1 Tax=Microbacterium sp. NPDC058021 TaxID=3346306 RepID=UPI0036D7AB25